MPINIHQSYWKALKNPVYLETGLLHGGSLLKAYKSKLFKQFYSIEVSQTHIDNFINKHKPIPKTLKLIHGNSKNLSDHIKDIDKPITFFLDAHDDQRFTKERKQIHDDPEIPCPLIEELEAIANHPVKGHKIMIDDMQCFTEGFKSDKHSWFKQLSFNQVINKVKELFPNYGVYLLDSYRPKDLLVCLPETITIPKILHMTYKNIQYLPDLFKHCKDSAQQYYRDFELMFHDDNDIEVFMEQYYPDFKEKVFDKLPLKIMKLDVFRYCLLDTHGGLYLDMDHEIVRRYSFLRSGLFLFLNRDHVSGDTQKIIGNSIIASVPNHPFWEYLRLQLENELPKTLQRFNNNSNITNNNKTKQTKDHKNLVIESTGPKFLTRTYNEFAKNFDIQNVKVIPRKVFHSPRPKNQKELMKFLESDNQYGFHHCAGTWHKSSS